MVDLVTRHPQLRRVKLHKGLMIGLLYVCIGVRSRDYLYWDYRLVWIPFSEVIREWLSAFHRVSFRVIAFMNHDLLLGQTASRPAGL